MVLESSPLVSVVIATLNRAELLKQSIHSVLNQSFGDFELIVVDDGSSDQTEEMVRSIGDDRIRYFRTGESPRGISAARNLGARESRGLWTAVHDDDDLMLPHRLENQLRFADSGADFIYGAFINFDDETGELQLHHGRNMTYGAALATGFAPGHSTWLVKTELVRRFGYDEGLESAVDNNLAFRMLRSGVEMVHSGTVCLLRRVHSGRITDTGSSNQKYAAELNLRFLRTNVNSASRKKLWKAARYDWGPVDKDSWQLKALSHLPNHLVARSGTFFEFEPTMTPNTTQIRHSQASEMTAEDFYRLSAEGAYLGDVRVRLREIEEIEDIISLQPLQPVGTEDVASCIVYNLSQEHEDAEYVVVGLVGEGSYLTLDSDPGVKVFAFEDQTYLAKCAENLVEAGQIDAKWRNLKLETFISETDKRPW